MLIPKSGRLSDLVAPGENPRGVVSQNGNGTIVDGRGGDGTEYLYGPMSDGERWNSNPLIPEMDKPIIDDGTIPVRAHRRRRG